MKKKLYLLIIPLIIVISTVVVIVYKNNYEVLKNSHTSKNTNTEMFSIMLETSANSGAYEQSSNNSWPTSGYTFNKNLSYCENGSTLTWNNANNTVSLGVNKTDKCYVYFDVEVSDITVAVSNKPTTVGMLANLNCTGATSSYNQKYNRIEVSQLNNQANCTLNYTNRPSKDYLNAKIMELAWMTQGGGRVVQENGYRYEGQDPNNYVWFNDELWRIIGVFDSSSHGVSNTNLVKIIRANSIGGLVWDKSNNNWSTASLKNLLNDEYLYSKNGTNGENCYGDYSQSAPPASKCDYRATGIKDGYRGMVKEVTWYLGGYSSSYVLVDSLYNYERSSTKYSSNPSSVSAKVGLMYASDYGYAASSISCSRSSNYMQDYLYNTNCTLENWLYGMGNEWTITPNSSNSYSAFKINSTAGDGNLGGNITNYGYGVRPSLYLDASVFVISGDGSESNPYIIGM